MVAAAAALSNVVTYLGLALQAKLYSNPAFLQQSRGAPRPDQLLAIHKAASFEAHWHNRSQMSEYARHLLMWQLHPSPEQRLSAAALCTILSGVVDIPSPACPVQLSFG